MLKMESSTASGNVISTAAGGIEFFFQLRSRKNCKCKQNLCSTNTSLIVAATGGCFEKSNNYIVINTMNCMILFHHVTSVLLEEMTCDSIAFINN